MNVSKYWVFLVIMMQQYFVYRLNFILWRVRMVLNLLLIYFLWNSITAGGNEIAGYSQGEILTYVFVVKVLESIVMSTKTAEISGEILSGAIINYLTKPYEFFRMTGVKDAADKILNTLFSIGEITLIILLLQPPLVFPQDAAIIPLFLVSVLVAMGIAFYFSLAIAFVAFWMSDVWGPRFIYIMITFFFAGSYYPLDILPDWLYHTLLLTPFPYMLYIPAKIFVEGFSTQSSIFISVGVIWVSMLYICTKALWNKGMRDFSFYGK